MNDYNAAAISIVVVIIGVVICGAIFLLFLYLRDYTQFFDRLFGTMEPEEYCRGNDSVGLYRRLKHCVVIDGLRGSGKTSAYITEICQFASLADSERWSDLANPDVVNALAFLASMGIAVDVWAKHGSTDTRPFRVHLYNMDVRYRKIIDEYRDKYCGDTISSQRLIQFANELKEDMSHVESIL